jgi:peptide-methionine (S)-S-oxide reductase
LACLGAFAWGYRAIWAVDPLSVPAVNDGWGLTVAAKPKVNLETATLAAGCFWGVESSFRKVRGVIRTRVGYTGGLAIEPSYLVVESQHSGHAEAIDIEFDPARVSYQDLLGIFFNIHDPTAVNPSEYRSAIFYHTPRQHQIAEKKKHELDESGQYVGPITTEITPARTFYPAEQYHQRYYEGRGADHVCRLGDGKKRKV